MSGALVYENGQLTVRGNDPSNPVTGTTHVSDLDASGGLSGGSVTVGGQPALDASTGFGGDISGTYDSITVAQVDCPASETWPSNNSKISFFFDEGGGLNELYFLVQDSLGNQFYTGIVLTPYSPP